MSDDDLRRLQREVATTGSPTARLAYAHALERAGRRDDALEALVPAIEDPDVRRELARWPAWHRSAFARWSSRALDVPPIAGPKVRMAWRIEGRGWWSTGGHLVASPLAIVASFAHSLTVVDPWSGQVRLARELDLSAPEPSIHGREVLLIGRQGVVELDPFGGERPLDELQGDIDWRLAADGPWIFVLERLGELVGWRRGAERYERAWSCKPTIPVAVPARELFVAGDRLLLRHQAMGQTSYEVRDLATGGLVLEGHGYALLDDAGVFSTAEPDVLVALDRAGTERWRLGELAGALASSPRYVVAMEAPGGRSPHMGERVTLRVLERTTGALLGRLREVAWPFQVALVRDRIYLISRSELMDPDAEPEAGEYRQELSAFTPAGEVAWCFDLTPFSTQGVMAFAPLPRRLCVLLNGGTLLCLADA